MMRRPPTNGDGRGLTEVKDIEPPLVKENWQNDAYSFTEAIGEMGYALNLKANTVAECKIRAEVRMPDSDEWDETTDARVRRVVAAFKPPQGDQGELLRQAALAYEIAGECYLFGQPVRDEHDRPQGLLWEFLSTLECRIEGGGKVIRNAWGGSRGREEIEVDAYVARLHHRDPRYSERADCPVRRILPICRELVLLTQLIDAIAKTRLSAGLLYVPWEISPNATPNEWEDPGNAESGFDEFEEELAEHLNGPIEDRTAASSLNPLLMRGPALIKDKLAKDAIGIIDLSRPLDGLYKELRQEALTRLAAGLDIPPEILSGKANLNHWTGANIDADFVAKHVIPLGRVIMEFLTTAYLRPMLVTFEGMDPAEAAWYRLSLDTSPITANIDRSQNATMGVQLEIVSDEAWVRFNGFDEQDIADEAERKRRTLERLLYAQPSLGPNILPMLYPGDPEIQAAIKDWKVGESTPGGAQAPPQPVAADGKASGPQAPPQPLLATLPQPVIDIILAASDRELDRALERAANRLTSRLSGIDKAYAETLRKEKRTEVLTIAGVDRARDAGLGPEQLFDGCWDELQVRVAEWVRVALEREGLEPYAATQASVVAASELGHQLTLHAGTALRRSMTVGRNGFKVPTEIVLSALTAGDLSARE